MMSVYGFYRNTFVYISNVCHRWIRGFLLRTTLLVSNKISLRGSVALFVFIICAGFGCTNVARASELLQDTSVLSRAEIIRIVDEREEIVPETNVRVRVQTLEARLIGGERGGEMVRFENDFTPLSENDVVYVNLITTTQGDSHVVVKDYDRRGVLVAFGILFGVVLFLFAGWKGLRALLSLCISVVALIFVLVPSLLAGYAPVPMTLFVALVVLTCAVFLTYGFRASTIIAFIGMCLSVVITCGLAALAVKLAHFNGFGSDASLYLNISTAGALDLPSVLLAGMIIGILGIVDDVAITQVSSIIELSKANASYTARQLYRAAMRIGRNHTASLVNTLAFAYAGTSLPLMMLLYRTDAPIGFLINQEVVSDELLRLIVGSIGLTLAVPITTYIAAWYYGRKNRVSISV